MEVLAFGRALLVLATVLTAAAFVLALAGILRRSRRLVVGARTTFYVLFVVICGSTVCLVHGLVTGQYDNEYIFNYSERLLPTFFKMAGLWAGLDGSLLFWTVVLSGFCAIVALQHRRSAQHATGRRLEPFVYLVLASVLGFFVAVNWYANPFEVMPPEQRELLSTSRGIEIGEDGRLLDGAGMSPQLVNYWFVIHPPCLYLGFIGFTVPFAFALAALMAGELGSYWVKIVRRWTMVAWLFLTSGIILGGLWAYRQLGWGGYWMWDPVENASFLPWCTGTAFLHSIMVQERREMLKAWNAFLIIFTFFLTIWATWMTRSGVVQSIHAFAGGNIGVWFQGFMLVIGFVGLFFLFYRWRQLKSRNRFDAVLSRESVFLFNNVVLVAIMAAVMILSFWTKLSHDFLAEKKTLLVAEYNEVMTPLFAALLFLTAIGPGLGWVKTTRTALRRNFIGPALATVGFLVCLYAWWYFSDQLGTASEVLVPKASMNHATALYPTGLFLGLSFFIAATIGAELWRCVRARMRFRGDDLGRALLNVVVRNNRRWGGYAVHVGIAVFVVGIIASSMFKTERQVRLRLGESAVVGSYRIAALEEHEAQPGPGAPYMLQKVTFRVTEVDEGLLPAAHGDAAAPSAEGVSSSGDEEVFIADLEPEIRTYPKRNETIREVGIERRLLGDIYLHYEVKLDDRFQVTVHLNPLMILIYLGWFMMVGGGIFAALPMPGNKVGLAD